MEAFRTGTPVDGGPRSTSGSAAMYLAYTAGPHCLQAAKKMGRDGWLGIGWAKEYGSQGRVGGT